MLDVLTQHSVYRIELADGGFNVWRRASVYGTRVRDARRHFTRELVLGVGGRLLPHQLHPELALQLTPHPPRA